MAKKHGEKHGDEGLARSVAGDGNAGLQALQLATLKDLRKGAKRTQQDLAETLGVGQDTISRLEKRSDMLLSTLRHYVESVGGQLTLVATFADQRAVRIDHLGTPKPIKKRSASPAKAATQDP